MTKLRTLTASLLISTCLTAGAVAQERRRAPRVARRRRARELPGQRRTLRARGQARVPAPVQRCAGHRVRARRAFLLRASGLRVPAGASGCRRLPSGAPKLQIAGVDASTSASTWCSATRPSYILGCGAAEGAWPMPPKPTRYLWRVGQSECKMASIMNPLVTEATCCARFNT